MIRYVFLKELQCNLLSSKILITWGILILIFILNAISSSVDIFKANKSFNLIEQENNERMIYDEEAGLFNELIAKASNKPYERKNGLDMLTFARQNLVKKGTTLSFISDTDANVPNGSDMFYFLMPSIKTNSSSNIYLNALYSLSWSRIFIFILGFVIACFSYDAFSGEKEQGTLKLMLSSRISRFSIVVGKYLGLLITFIIPLMIALVITIVMVMVSPRIEFLKGDAVKLLLFVFAGIVFISMNILVGFMISCLSKTSAVSLSINLIVWTILAVIFPSTSWLGINRIKPIPTIAEVNDEIRIKQDDLKDCSLEWRSDWVGKEPTEGLLRRKECCDRRTKIETDVWWDYYNRLFSQTETAISIASISPFSSFQFLCDKLTDNGYYGYSNFYNQVVDYQKQYRNFIDDKDQADKNSSHLIWNENYYTCYFMSNKKIDANEIPMFTYEPSSIREVLKSSVWNIFYLSGWAILLFASVCIVFFRYDVR
ncbi:MAG: ABC transporter permease subunit [Bacteroidales bacterium]|nr:ABC transporter permease subunit [Bacteroidales bacterium]